MLELADVLRFAGIALIVFFLFRMQMRRERSRRKEQHREESKPRSAQVESAHSTSPASMSRRAEVVELELHTTARDVLAEIQTKTAILQQLIVDAHQAAERLERATQNGERRDMVA